LGEERGVSFLRGLFRWYWYWSKKCDKTRKYKKRVENSIRRRKRREKKKLARYVEERGSLVAIIISWHRWSFLNKKLFAHHLCE
jgi:hypothetical protein